VRSPTSQCLHFFGSHTFVSCVSCHVCHACRVRVRVRWCVCGRYEKQISDQTQRLTEVERQLKVSQDKEKALYDAAEKKYRDEIAGLLQQLKDKDDEIKKHTLENATLLDKNKEARARPRVVSCRVACVVSHCVSCRVVCVLHQNSRNTRSRYCGSMWKASRTRSTCWSSGSRDKPRSPPRRVPSPRSTTSRSSARSSTCPLPNSASSVRARPSRSPRSALL